jgi:hypothetical protein
MHYVAPAMCVKWYNTSNIYKSLKTTHHRNFTLSHPTVLRINPRVLGMLGKYSTTELHPQHRNLTFNIKVILNIDIHYIIYNLKKTSNPAQ